MPRLLAREKAIIPRLYNGGISPYEMAEMFDCSTSTVYYHLHQAGISPDYRAMQDKPAWNNGIPRTPEEKQKISEATKLAMTPEICQHLSNLASARIGELSNNWKGGKWTELVYPSDFGAIKYQIRERDNYTCQSCGTKNNTTNDWELDVHHKDGDGFNNQLDNLVTLCRSCHKIAEAKLRAERKVMDSR